MNASASASSPTAPPETRLAVPRVLAVAAAWAWRIAIVALVVVGALWLLREARVVVVPIVLALFLTRAMSPVSARLRDRGWPAGLAVAVTMVVSAVLLAVLIAVAVRSLADEADSLGPTITAAIDDIEDWVVEDSPFDISRSDADSARQRLADGLQELVRTGSDGAIAERATVVGEVVTGAVLTVVLTFFLMRDGRRLANWTVERSDDDRAGRVRRSLDAAWRTLAGYLRGAAILGVTEAIIIGITLWIVGADLVTAVMILTVLAAFVPVLGAAVAGVVAVLVALVTAGTGAAIAVAIVALLVQQFDNDLLAPVIYGRALALHPAAVLVSVVTGGALFGIAGTVLAVPLVAVTVNVIRQYTADEPDADESQLAIPWEPAPEPSTTP